MTLASPSTRSFVVGLLLVGLQGALATAAENWPQWRGPLVNGDAGDGDYPVEFSSDEGVAWKVALPGVGCSTPAVWGDSIFVTCGIDGQDGVVCYGLDGSERWRRQLGPERPGKHRNGSGSNPSPVTDGKHVVAYFKSGTLACFDLDGRQSWRVNLQEEFGKDTLWWDVGTSPVLAGDRVIVAVIQEGDAYVVAFDVTSGDVLWREPRPYECTQETDHAYTTPQVVSINGQPQLVVWGADHLTGHDLPTGKLVWECGGFNPDDQRNWRAIASPVFAGDLALVPYGRGDFLAGVRLGGEGDVTSSARVWEKEGRGLGSDVPTPAVRDGLAYVLGDAGRVSCIDMQSGDERWSENLPRNRNKFFSSPVLAGDKLYCAREDGILFVGRATSDGFELLAENDMGEPTIAAPVPIRGGLLVRGREHLFRIEP
jgi:outer membrane protein assembly factor BamB